MPTIENKAFPLKMWAIAIGLLAGLFWLIAVQARHCAAEAAGYVCAAPYDGLEKLLLFGVLVAGLGFLIGLAVAILKTVGWVYHSRKSR